MKNKHLSTNLFKFEYVVFNNGDVYNLDTSTQIHPVKDKRRPHLPPTIHLMYKTGKRLCIPHDKLIAQTFIDEYIDGMFIHHKDGDINNCSSDNLFVGNGGKILREIYKEEKIWKPINIPNERLYFEYWVCEDSRVFNATTNSFIKPFIDHRDGNYNYRRYNLYRSVSSKDCLKVSASRLVAIHFIPKPEKKDIVLFKDLNRDNIHYSNLFWGDEYDKLNQDIETEELLNIREFSKLSDPLMGKEKWKPLDIGIEMKYDYLISNFGRIYNDTKKHYVTISKGSDTNINGQTHKHCTLYIKNIGYKTFSIHRLVAIHFVKNKDPNKYNCVNHINGNPECNLSINLEWCTQMDNMRHAINTNLINSIKFKNKASDDYWRTNTIIAWIYSHNISGNKAFEVYNTYSKMYDDNILYISSSDELEIIFNDKITNDEDFIKIYNFYKSEYGTR